MEKHQWYGILKKNGLKFKKSSDSIQRKMVEGLGLFYGLYNTAYWVILDHVEQEQIQKENKIIKLGLWLEEIMKLILEETEKMRQGKADSDDVNKNKRKTKLICF